VRIIPSINKSRSVNLVDRDRLIDRRLGKFGVVVSPSGKRQWKTVRCPGLISSGHVFWKKIVFFLPSGSCLAHHAIFYVEFISSFVVLMLHKLLANVRIISAAAHGRLVDGTAG
jgi:hypothetical protein